MSRLAVYVQGDDYTQSALIEGLEITQNVTDRISQATLSFVAQSGAGTRYDESNYDEDVYSTDVRELYDIRIQDRDTGAGKFAGTIRKIKPVRKNQAIVFYECECADYSTALDEAYIELQVFANETDQNIVYWLLTTFVPALSVNLSTIQHLCTLPTWEIRDKTVRQALDEIVEFSGGEWRIDANKAFFYFRPTDYLAPFGLSSTPNSVAQQIGLRWDEATGTWNTMPDTWDSTGTQGIETTTLTWNAATNTWNEQSGTWNQPGSLGLITYGIDALTDYDRDAIRIINQCTVLGGVVAGGERLRVVYEDPLSQLDYGIRPQTVVDDSILDGYNAMLRAKAIVEDNAWPRETISLRTFVDGLEAGQSLPLFHAPYSINGTYLIRELRQRQVGPGLTEYSITAGARPPDALRLLKQLEARTRKLTAAPTAVPADNTVGNNSIVVGGLTADVIGSIHADRIFGTITADQIISIDAAVIGGQIVANQIGTVNAVSIEGVITAGQIGSLNAAVINGVIVSRQVADDLIDRLSMFQNALRPIPNLGFFPGLPDPNHPAGAFFYHIGVSKFYENQGGAWAEVAEGAAVGGKLAFYHVGTIKAGSIIGLIAAGQIDTIAASQITGAIDAAHIGTVNVSSLVGTLTSGNTARIDIGAVQGNIDVSRVANITSIAISSLQGTLSISRIDNINTLNIGSLGGTIGTNQIGDFQVTAQKIANFTITAQQIANYTITANQIAAFTISSGQIANLTITANQIDNLTITGVKIASGAITDDKVFGNLSASKITTGTLNALLVNVTNLNAANITTGNFSADRIGAGTISATVTMTSPRLDINTPPNRVLIDATNYIRVSHTFSSMYTQVTYDGTRVFNPGGVSSAFIGTQVSTGVPGGTGALLSCNGSNSRMEVINNFGQTMYGFDTLYGSVPSAGGGSSTLPAGPLGFFQMYIAGSLRKVPYYS